MAIGGLWYGLVICISLSLAAVCDLNVIGVLGVAVCLRGRQFDRTVSSYIAVVNSQNFLSGLCKITIFGGLPGSFKDQSVLYATSGE